MRLIPSVVLVAALMAPLRCDAADNGGQSQDCAIVAAIAVTRLHNAGLWARPLGLKVERPDGSVQAHVLTIFEFENRKWAYDSSGTHRLETDSYDIADIVARIQARLDTGWIIHGYVWLDTSDKELK